MTPEMQVVGELLKPLAKASLCWRAHGSGLRWFQSCLHGFQPQFSLLQNGNSHRTLPLVAQIGGLLPHSLRETGRLRRRCLQLNTGDSGSHSIEPRVRLDSRQDNLLPGTSSRATAPPAAGQGGPGGPWHGAVVGSEEAGLSHGEEARRHPGGAGEPDGR